MKPGTTENEQNFMSDIRTHVHLMSNRCTFSPTMIYMQLQLDIQVCQQSFKHVTQYTSNTM